jgi:thiol:disulfide interchange protein DsbC
MMEKMKQLFVIAVSFFAVVASVWAEDLAAVEKQLREKFAHTQPALPVESVEETPIPGLYSIHVKNGPTIYSTAEGEYFVLGDLYQVQRQRFVNIAEQQREGSREKLLASVKIDDMIVFAPEEQPSKAVINVFTDVDCFYCQKLHREIPDLNKAGIEVRYLAYPRAGLGSDSFKKIASAWCAEDKQAALTKLKNRKKIPSNVCSGNPIAAQFKLGNQMGVNGTPALVTQGGRLMPGYMPALQLAKTLGVELEPGLEAELMVKQQAGK